MTDVRAYEEETDSRITWLGRMPGHWQLLPGRACYRQRKVPNAGLKETQVLSLSFGRIVIRPHERLRGLVPGSFETYQVIEPGDIVVRPTDLQNDWNSLRFGLSTDRGIITSAYLCLRTTEKLTREYGHLLLLAYDLQKVFYGLGSGLRQNLDWSDFRYLPCLVPPIEEQHAIVRFLDHADRRIRRAIAAKQKLIALLNEQKQVVTQRAVTQGLDPRTPLKPSGADWFGDVPAHWDVVELKHVLRRLIDCEHKTAPAVSSSDYRVVRTTAVRHGRLRLAGTYGTSAEAFAEWTRRGVPEPGDVIFTREAPAGEACVVPPQLRVCLGQRTVLMKVRNDRYDPQFLVHMIYAGPPLHRIKLASQGSTVGHFNMDDIAALKVTAPPLAEQEAIVRHIAEETRGIEHAEVAASREIELLREYRVRLIVDIVTGKLDIRDAATRLPAETDEPELPDQLHAEESELQLEELEAVEA